MKECDEGNLKPHKNLKAWQAAKELALAVYRATENVPAQERFGLVLQMRRAAVSAPSKIAEGAAGRTSSQFSNVLSTAMGSLNELDTQLETAFQLGCLSPKINLELQQLIDRTIGLMYGLKRSILNRQKGIPITEDNQ